MRPWTVIQNKSEYDAVVERIEELSKNPPEKNSDEGRELMLLGFLAARYEEENFPIDYPDPVDAIKVRMEDLNLSVSDLLDVFGDRGTASKVLGRKRALSVNMIRKLAERLSLPEALLIRTPAMQTKKKDLKKSALVKESKQSYKKKPRGKKTS